MEEEDALPEPKAMIVAPVVMTTSSPRQPKPMTLRRYTEAGVLRSTTPLPVRPGVAVPMSSKFGSSSSALAPAVLPPDSTTRGDGGDAGGDRTVPAGAGASRPLGAPLSRRRARSSPTGVSIGAWRTLACKALRPTMQGCKALQG